MRKLHVPLNTCMYEYIFFKYTGKFMKLSSFSCHSSLSASLLIVAQHLKLSENQPQLCSKLGLLVLNSTILFFFIFFFSQGPPLLPYPNKRLFFLFFIICKFLMYKLKSDHLILVLSKHAQNTQNPSVKAPSSLSVPFLLVYFFSLEGAEHPLPGAPTTHW